MEDEHNKTRICAQTETTRAESDDPVIVVDRAALFVIVTAICDGVAFATRDHHIVGWPKLTDNNAGQTDFTGHFTQH